MISWIIIISMLTVWEFYNMRKKDLKNEKVILVFISLLSLTMAYLYTKHPYDISIAGFALNLFGYSY